MLVITNPLIVTKGQSFLLSSTSSLLCKTPSSSFTTRYIVYKNKEESDYGYYTFRAIVEKTDSEIAEQNKFCKPIGGGCLEFVNSENPKFVLSGFSDFGDGFHTEVKSILKFRYPTIPVEIK